MRTVHELVRSVVPGVEDHGEGSSNRQLSKFVAVVGFVLKSGLGGREHDIHLEEANVCVCREPDLVGVLEVCSRVRERFNGGWETRTGPLRTRKGVEVLLEEEEGNTRGMSM